MSEERLKTSTRLRPWPTLGARGYYYYNFFASEASEQRGGKRREKKNRLATLLNQRSD